MRTAVLVLLLTILLVCYGCRKETIGPEPANLPPETYFANVPPDSSQIPYRIILYWYGNDPDGFVIGYEYAINDSTEGWTWVEATEDTIDFPAPNLSDLDSIWVRAVDDDSARDPTPAMRYYTATTIAPETWIMSGHPHPEVYCLEQATVTWPGIIFCYGGMDPDGEVVGYQTQVSVSSGPNVSPDSQAWSEETTEPYVSLVNLEDGEHTFWVRSIDNAGARDPSPAKLAFTVIVPRFELGALLIDQTLNYPPVPVWPTDAQVDSFYWNLFPRATGFRHPWTDYDYSGYSGTVPGTDTIPPSRELLGHYELLIYHNDDWSVGNEPAWFGRMYEVLEEYLDVGGKLWFSGFDNLYTWVGLSAGAAFSPWQFPYEYLGIQAVEVNQDLEPADFQGAFGQLSGYPDLQVDSLKAIPQGQWWGKLKSGYALTPRPEAQVIYTFDSFRDNPRWEGRPCAILYERGDSKIVFFGFPLYPIEVDSEWEPLTETARTLWEWLEMF